MARTKPKKRSPKKRRRKLRKKNHVSFTLVLLTLMLTVGAISGIVAYTFGQQALEGVKPIPAGRRTLQTVPAQETSPAQESTEANP